MASGKRMMAIRQGCGYHQLPGVKVGSGKWHESNAWKCMALTSDM